jgi:hypothetical protein
MPRVGKIVSGAIGKLPVICRSFCLGRRRAPGRRFVADRVTLRTQLGVEIVLGSQPGLTYRTR